MCVNAKESLVSSRPIIRALSTEIELYCESKGLEGSSPLDVLERVFEFGYLHGVIEGGQTTMEAMSAIFGVTKEGETL